MSFNFKCSYGSITIDILYIGRVQVDTVLNEGAVWDRNTVHYIVHTSYIYVVHIFLLL